MIPSGFLIAGLSTALRAFHQGGVVRGPAPDLGLRKTPSPYLGRIEMPRCKAIQQSDEMHCAMCGLRWDVNDSDPPKCRAAR